MAIRKIIWSRTAYLQRKNILLYWVDKNKSNIFSIKLLKQTQKATKQLAQFPYLGKVTDIENVYCFAMGNYNLYYTFSSELDIQIVTFWDNRQNPEILNVLISLFKK